jgi:2'-phosphotransferase
MDSQERVKLSKKLSYLLRHGAQELGLTVQSDGYIQVNHILRCPGYRGASLNKIIEVVQSCQKKRFEMKQDPSTGLWWIRASQGHTITTINDTELLTEILPDDRVDYCLHGTYVQHLDSIQSNGLHKMQRNHIHFAEGLPGDNGVISGMRGNCTAVVIVDMKGAMRDGILFYRSANNVILSAGVGDTGAIPSKYFIEILTRKNPQSQFQSLTLSSLPVPAPAPAPASTVSVIPSTAVSPSVTVTPSAKSTSRVQHLSGPPSVAAAPPPPAPSLGDQKPSSSATAPMSWANLVQANPPSPSSHPQPKPAPRKSNPPPPSPSSSTPPSSAPSSVDYYCIIDFEATCLQDVRITPQEIIEFPAIMINALTMKTVEEELGSGHGVFHSYIRPIHHPRLSSFCTELTGIEQATVDAAPTFPLVYERFLHFLQPFTRSSSLSYPLTPSSSSSSSASSSSSPSLPPSAYSPVTYSNIVFVSHGDFDFQTALRSQCHLSSVKTIVTSWINIKTIFTNLERTEETKKTRTSSRKGGRRQGLGMAAMLHTLNMPLIGRHHSGIDDSRNIARIFLELVRRGGDLTLLTTMSREYHRGT